VERRLSTTINRLLLAVTALLSSVKADQAQVHTEDRVKAAIVIQLAKFVEWQQAAPTPDDFFICVAGKDEWLPVLREVGAKQTIGGRQVRILSIRQPQDLLPCRMVVQGQSVYKQLAEAIEMVSVLTVGEEIGFATKGGMVGLTVESGKVVFEINPQAARRKGIRFSSKLMRLARVIGGDAPP